MANEAHRRPVESGLWRTKLTVALLSSGYGEEADCVRTLSLKL
jgi:hypothetical protein